MEGTEQVCTIPSVLASDWRDTRLVEERTAKIAVRNFLFSNP